MFLNLIQAGTTSVFIAKNIKIKIKKFFILIIEDDIMQS